MVRNNKIEKIEDFIVYQKAMELYNDFINEDMEILSKHFIGKRLALHLAGSLDSICANMEEGYGRKAGKEFKQFLRISRGSTRESKGRYLRCAKFLPKQIIENRVGRLDEIVAMLHSLIGKLSD